MPHRRMQSPIHSVKHYVPLTNGFVAANAIDNADVVDAIVAPGNTNAQSVQEGAQVKAVWIELWIFNAGATTTTTQFIITLEKTVAGQTDMTFAEAANLRAYPNKKNILYTTQGVLPANIDGSGAIPIIRQWFKIPKGKQRFGLGDKVLLNVATIGQNLRRCGMFIFKEYQ